MKLRNCAQDRTRFKPQRDSVCQSCWLCPDRRIKQTSGKRFPDEPHYPDASKLSRLGRTQAPARWHHTSYLALVGVGAMQHAINDPSCQSWQLGLDLRRKQASRTRVPLPGGTKPHRLLRTQARRRILPTVGRNTRAPQSAILHNTEADGCSNPPIITLLVSQMLLLWEYHSKQKYDMSTIRDR